MHNLNSPTTIILTILFVVIALVIIYFVTRRKGDRVTPPVHDVKDDGVEPTEPSEPSGLSDGSNRIEPDTSTRSDEPVLIEDDQNKVETVYEDRVDTDEVQETSSDLLHGAEVEPVVAEPVVTDPVVIESDVDESDVISKGGVDTDEVHEISSDLLDGAEVEPVVAEPVVAEPEVEEKEEEEEPAPSLSIFDRFKERLTKSRNQLGSQLRSIFGGGIDEDMYEELEDSLISADVGVDTTLELVERLRNVVKEKGITDGSAALAELKEILRGELVDQDRSMNRRAEGTSVWLFTGVNGTGKTTSIGKLSKKLTENGDKIVLAAADTFRAAAAEQLKIWGERSNVRVIAQEEGADPAAVAFDGYKAAKAAKADIVLIDTAGRLQNKTSLMEELSKIKRVVEREAGEIDEAILVLDATTGQNGLSQAKAFAEAVNLTGVILTKLDGTAKGGIVLAIGRELGVPVKWVGLGEGIDDLAAFDPEAFIDALFAE